VSGSSENGFIMRTPDVIGAARCRRVMRRSSSPCSRSPPRLASERVRNPAFLILRRMRDTYGEVSRLNDRVMAQGCYPFRGSFRELPRSHAVELDWSDRG
jgi:hypothetical protein